MRSLGKVLLLLITSMCSLSISGGAVNASITTLQYFDNDQGAYLEIYSRIIRNSLVGDQSGVELTIMIQNGDQIVEGAKYLIQSPTKDTLDFWDVKRFKLENGEYTLSMSMVDPAASSDTMKYEEKLDINNADYFISNSDVLLMSEIQQPNVSLAFTKGNFGYEPLSFNLYGPDQNQFTAYLELYNLTSKEGDFFLKYYTKSEDGSQVGKEAYKRIDKSAIEVAFFSHSIENYISGNYTFHVEVINKEKEVLHLVKQQFAVYHPDVDIQNLIYGDKRFETSFVQFMDEGELDYALKAIFPKIGNNHTTIINQIIWGDNIDAKKFYLYSYWSNYAPDNTKIVYDQYMEVARAIDRMYITNVGHGFESDRGYIFLKYGKPNDVVAVEEEPSAPPYEIWIYNEVAQTQQSNVRFLFYNPSLSHNDYTLLHSTCRGEVSNANWVNVLYEDAVQAAADNPTGLNDTSDGLNRNALRYFSDF